MVDSPMYDRLMRLVAAIESASALDASDNEHNTIVCGLNEANNVTHHMRSYQGFTGETGDQIDAWTDTTMKQVQGIKENHNTAMEYYVEARRAMTHIREEAQQLSPTLIDSNLQNLADMTHVAVPVTEYLGPFGGPINTLAVSADAYFQTLIAQANAQREVAATDILERANNTMQGLADGIGGQRDALANGSENQEGKKSEGPSSPHIRRDIENGYLNVSPHAPGVYPGDRDSDYGRSDLRGTGSGLYADGYDEGGPVNGRAMSSPRIPNEYITEGEVGSRLNPVTDPQDLMGIDLLHTRVNGDRHANGTVGGYTPAPPVDRYHPLWNVNGGPGSESALAARMGGAGVLGAGALGMGAASRLGAGGMSALGVRVLPVPLVAVFRVRLPFAQDHTRALDMEHTRLLRPVGQGPVRVARPPPPVAPRHPVRYRPQSVLVRGTLAVQVASWEEQVPAEPAARTIRRSRRVVSTRPSALRMMEMNCPRAT